MGLLEDITLLIFDWIISIFEGLGLFGSVIALILIMIAQAIIAPIISEAILATAGGAFQSAFGTAGLWAAIIGGIIGSLLGSISSFYIARWLQEHFLKGIVDKYDEDAPKSLISRIAHFSSKFIDEESEDFVQIIKERGFLFVLVGRLLPFIPFDAVSYGSGFTRIEFRDYFTATTIGTVPRVVFYVLLGSILKDRLQSGDFTGFMLLLLLIIVLIYVLYRLTLGYLRNQKAKTPMDRNIGSETE